MFIENTKYQFDKCYTIPSSFPIVSTVYMLIIHHNFSKNVRSGSTKAKGVTSRQKVATPHSLDQAESKDMAGKAAVCTSSIPATVTKNSTGMLNNSSAVDSYAISFYTSFAY